MYEFNWKFSWIFSLNKRNGRLSTQVRFSRVRKIERNAPWKTRRSTIVPLCRLVLRRDVSRDYCAEGNGTFVRGASSFFSSSTGCENADSSLCPKDLCVAPRKPRISTYSLTRPALSTKRYVQWIMTRGSDSGAIVSRPLNLISNHHFKSASRCNFNEKNVEFYRAI